ncbi:SET domain containing 2 [Carabus blaptoides fortunei]
MARKKRGGKAAANRKSRTAKLLEIVNEESITQSPTESEESCSSGTPKSCNTPIEIEKAASNPTTMVQHKKFGKFRCLLMDEANKTEVSSSESEIQIDSLEVDPKEVEIITIDPDNIIDDFKSVEISDSDQLHEIQMVTEEVVDIIQQEIAEDIMEEIIEIDDGCDGIPEQETICETEVNNDFVGTIQISDESQEQCYIILQPDDDSSTDNRVVEECELKLEESEIVKMEDSDLKLDESEELNAKVQELDTAAQELNIEDSHVQIEETDVQIQEFNVQTLQTSVQIHETDVLIEETDVKSQELDIKVRETDDKLPDLELKSQEGEENYESKKSNDADTNSDSSNTATVRRSSRIKSYSVLKQRSRGHGLVKSDKSDKKESKSNKTPKPVTSDLELSENSNSNAGGSDKNSAPSDSPSFVAPTVGVDPELKPVKVKSRWRRSSELEMGSSSPITISSYLHSSPQIISEVPEHQAVQVQTQKEESPVYDEEMENRLRQFQTLTENQYLTERTSCKEAKKMVCDCFLTKEEIERGEFGCGEDCLNRLLMIECGSQCVVNDRCTNKRFQKLKYSPCEVFRTEKKGFGIRATADISYGEFILEYVGEVLDPDEFEKRAKNYSQDKNRHYYFMALRADAVIDATQKGNISRFINHSCDPNAETQKWTVNGELRIGFFSKRTIISGEEITFDYQFQRYGKEAQKCYCESANCRGWIGEEPDEDDDDEDDDEDSEREEETEDQSKETDSMETDVKEPKKVVKKQVRKRRLNKKQLKDIFEDLDLDEEIGMLSTTGVKNQAHTLKLSRLMVRAKDVGPRMQLLKLLRKGDLPCRRLFLDYHGLRLIHGWMCDAASMTDSENTNYSFRMEILQTLALLPIPNKTMLQDSKVLSTVEKWSVNKTELTSSPAEDSASNSPQIDAVPIESLKKEDTKSLEQESMEVTDAVVELAVKMECDQDDNPSEAMVTSADNNDEVNSETKSEVTEIKEPPKEEDTSRDADAQEVKEKLELEIEQEIVKHREKKKEKLILDITTKLLIDWAILKEVFRIPKKERIEQMKEHEREADRDYKAGLGLEQELINKRDVRYAGKSERYRIVEKERRKSNKESSDHERNISKKGIRLEERNIVPIPKLSKHERRQLFALQVAQEEEGRRRKQEQEMWRIHEQRCMVMGADPRLTSLDMTNSYQWNWNPNTAQWQAYPTAGMATNQQPPPQGYPAPGIPPTQQPPPGFSAPGLPPANQQPPGFPPPNQQQPPMFVPPPQVCQNAPPPHIQMMMPSAINRPALLPQQYQPPSVASKEEVQFAGPPPPPVKLPPKWKCARDKYGRPYYYHVKLRMSQWEPPAFSTPGEDVPNEIADESSSSTESSSVSSDSNTDSDEDSELGDTKLLLEIRNKLKNIEKAKHSSKTNIVTAISNPVETKTESPQPQVTTVDVPKPLEPAQKRKRVGLVQEIIISPRREEDKIAHKAELKKYKETKEKLRKQKQLLMEQSKKRFKGKLGRSSSSKSSKKHRSSKSSKHKSLNSKEMNTEEAKKIKELFRSSMASVMVANLNAYRKPDCKLGRITNTEDFKHLARKLTHFVMLKELKHCQSIEDLTCNESVKAKAKDFVKKYMAKFGESYSRPKDEVD